MKALRLLLITLIIAMVSGIDMAARTIVICDRFTGNPIESALFIVKNAEGNKNVRIIGKSDVNGIIEIDEAVSGEVVIARTGYISKTIKLNNETEKIYYLEANADLPEVSAVLSRPLIKYTPDRIIYDVQSDSSAMNETAIQTLRKVPGIYVNLKGAISSDLERNIEFRLNGHRDPLTQNITLLLSSLDSRLLKNFELIVQPGLQYESNTVIININTKNRIEGYLANLFLGMSDNNIRPGLFGVTKYGRLRLSACYAYIYNQGHPEDTYTEESLLNPSGHGYSVIRSKHDNKSYRHGDMIEICCSYDIGENTLINAYASFFPSLRFHYNSVVRNIVDGVSELQEQVTYLKNVHHSDKRPEYNTFINFEKRYGNDGHLFVGYDYYSRPTDGYDKALYTVPSTGNVSLSDLPADYTEYYKTELEDHTFEAELERRFGNKHNLRFHFKSIFRNRSNRRSMFFMRNLERLHEEPDEDYFFKSRQFIALPSIAYTFRNDKILFSLGLRTDIQNDNIEYWNKGSKCKRGFVDWLPQASFSYSFSNTSSLMIRYSQTVLRPDAWMMNPYADRTTPGTIIYGNPSLKPQINYNLSVNPNFSIGRSDPYNIGIDICYSYSDRVMLGYRFLSNDIINITTANLGYKNVIKLSMSCSKRFSRFFLRVSPKIEYQSFNAGIMDMKNHGFYFQGRASVEYEFPKGYFLNFETNYHSNWIMLQGKGGARADYSLSASKSFMNRNLRINISAENFLTPHFTRKEIRENDCYHYVEKNRFFNAAFSVNIQYRFGKLKENVKMSDKRIQNEDIKLYYDE